MGANGNINDLELAKFIELAGEYGIRVHLLHGDSWLPSVANLAALPSTGNTTGDIRQLLDTGVPYRWNGSAWTVWISGSGASWGSIAGTLSAQTDLQSALDAKMGAGAYILTSRDSLLLNQINLGSLTSGILKQTVSAGVATISILTDNSGNWNTAYTHSQVTSGNPHNVTKTEVGLGNIDNTSDANKPVSTAQQTALNLKANLASPTFTGTATVPTPSNGTDAVTKAYADALVAGLLDYRGGYDASINLFPSTGGSGIAGAVVKGDMWIISVAGTLGGTAVQIGDSIIVNVDTPGQTAGNWNILDSNISYVPENVANKATTMTGNTASNTIYLSAKAIYDWVTTLLLASLTPKTTPVDADGFAIMDSAASNVMKFLSFTNIKAFLKTYFDTLYAKYLGDADFYKYSIVTSVASGNLTVALKNYEGNDPTPSKPVKIQIGGVVRTITSALSVTINAGTNWFNAGSSELATKEIDYFPYLRFFGGYQTVGLFFSRYPSANLVSDFSASGTYTNEKYGSDSDGVNALVTDKVVNIGRFAATLSAGGAYTWSIPATSVIINSPIYETRILNYIPVFTGLTAQPTLDYAFYKIIGNLLFLDIRSQAGTSNSIAFTATSPFSAGQFKATESCRVLDNGTWIVGGGSTEMSPSSNIVNYYTGMNGGVFTASGSKATISKMNYYI